MLVLTERCRVIIAIAVMMNLNPNELYDYEGKMLCSECLLGKYETIVDKE